MRRKDNSWARNSLLISLIAHGIVFIFLALYITGTVQKVHELLNAAFVTGPKPRKYEPRPQPVRPIMRPSAPRTQIADADFVSVDTQKRSSPTPGRTARTNALPRFSNEAMQDTVSPSSLTRSKIVPRVMTAAKILPSAITLPPSVGGGASGPGGVGSKPGTGGTGMGDGSSGYSRTILAAAKAPPGKQLLSMIDIQIALDVDDGLTGVAQGVTIGRQDIPTLPKGEPGGVVVGRGKDIKGRIRFTRIKHYLSDWWADPTAIPGVTQWMNAQTNIRADINVEGGSIMLNDPKLMKCPLAIMTGHDRALISTSIRGNYRNKFSEQERAGLRRYLIEAGGLLFFDECGHDVTLLRQLKGELREIIPEYSAERIPSQHELYSCFYDLGGAPPGAYRFWKHGYSRRTRATIGRYLEGIFIDKRLAVIFSDRDYLCAARTKNRPGHGNTGEESPAAYRFLTNVIVYSLTHGGVSEHSGYIPEITDADRISIDSPVLVPILAPGQ